MRMNIHIFRVGEVVQVLDETTHIWESAKIQAFNSDWSAKVKWVEWTSKKAVLIKIPMELQPYVEHWNIRKWTKYQLRASDTRPKRLVKQPGNNRPLPGNPARLSRHEQVIVVRCYSMV